MTLRATRDPTFGPDVHIGAGPDFVSADARRAQPPRLARLVSGVQLLSTLLAVPLGLASGYSIYRANFAPETNCQNLRASIIAMLDKNVDAATRHMLVRRDVETFEKSCGAFDPDAKAAFKRLLASDRVQPAAARHAEAKSENTGAKPKEKEIDTKSVRKAEPHPPAASPPAVKPAVANTVAPRVEPVRAQAAPPSDTAWVSAVREALVKHGVDSQAPVSAESAAAPAASSPSPLYPPLVEAVAPTIAPKLPEARVIAGSPQPPAMTQPITQPVADHPIPPAPIDAPLNTTPPRRSGVSAMISDIPLLGPVVDAVRGR